MQRDPRLHRLSWDHHHGLVVARRALRVAGGLEPGADPGGTWADLRERFSLELEPHFAIEERLLLPPLAERGESGAVDRTLADHRALRHLADGDAARGDPSSCLAEFGRILRDHIRWEERELFEIAQRTLPNEVLETVDAAARARGGDSGR